MKMRLSGLALLVLTAIPTFAAGGYVIGPFDHWPSKSHFRFESCPRLARRA